MIFKKLLRFIKRKYIDGHCIHFCSLCKFRNECWYDLLDDE